MNKNSPIRKYKIRNFFLLTLISSCQLKTVKTSTITVILKYTFLNLNSRSPCLFLQCYMMSILSLSWYFFVFFLSFYFRIIIELTSWWPEKIFFRNFWISLYTYRQKCGVFHKGTAGVMTYDKIKFNNIFFLLKFDTCDG